MRTEKASVRNHDNESSYRENGRAATLLSSHIHKEVTAIIRLGIDTNETSCDSLRSE
jgi:hypothetical protein